MKLIRWIFAILAVILALAAVAIGAAMLLLDTEQIKQQLTSGFERRTGHSLQIDAPLQWTFFPWLGLRLEQVVVGNAPGFGDQPLASIRELDVKVGLMPLLEKRIAVDTVRLRGIRLNLVRDRQGRGNWDALAGLEKKGASGVESRAQPAPKEKPSRIDQYQIHLLGVEVEDLDLNYVDEQKDTAYQFKGLELSLGELKPGQPVMVRLGGGLDLQDPPLGLKFHGSTELTISSDYQRIDLSAFSMGLEAKGEQLPEEGLEVEIAGDLALDLAAGKLAVADLSISGPQLHLTGALSIAGLGEKSRIEGSLGLQETNLKTLLALAGVELETADPEALTRVSFQLQMAQEGESLKIEPLRIKVDDTRIEGMVTLALHEPVLQARLKLDSIDLDRYRPLESEQAQVRQTVGDGGKPPPAEKVDFEPLRRLDANIVVEAERVEVSGLKLAKAKLTLKAKKGVISLDPVTSLLYNGRLKASSSLDVREKQPSVQVRSELVGIRVGPLLADLTGEERLTGTGKVSFSLRTRGMKEDAVRRNLDGDFSIDFRDGAYKGFNLAQAIRQAEAAIRGTTITEDEPRQTDFAELRASGIIRKGVLSNRDLYLASPVLRVRGKGEVDLVTEKVDYRLTAKVVGTLIGQGGKPMDRLKGLVIPVQLKGDLGDPSFRIDPEALAKAVAGKKLEEHKGKVIEKIEEKLGPGLLKGLLGK